MKIKQVLAAAAVTLGVAAAGVFGVLAETSASVEYANTHMSEAGALSEQNQLIYKEAKRQILEIAEGKRTNGILQINVKDALGIDVTDSKYEASLSELGLSASDFDDQGRGNTNATVAWQKWAESSSRGYFGYYTNGEWSKLNHAIWNGCSYELYWHDREVNGIDVWPVSVVLKDNGMVGMDETSYIPIAMSVRTEYRTTGTSDDLYNSYYTNAGRSMEINKEMLENTAEKTVPAAKAVVEKYKDLSDYEKLEAYRDYILDAVSYDSDAEKLIGSSTDEQTDAFFVTNVFDNDSSTNVVCEGYAKAFKFLCDLSTFEDETIDVNLVTGECTISTGSSSQTENHMWNIVTLNGKNYIVDLTNSDEGTMGENGNLFMVPASRSTDYSGKVYNNISGIYYNASSEEGQGSSRVSWSARYCYSTKEGSYSYKDYNDNYTADALLISSEAENSFADADEAAAYLAQQMKAREERIVFSYTGSTSGFTTDSFRELLNRAYTHTGAAGLGDNLRRQIDAAVPATANTTYIYNVEYRNTAAQEAQLEQMASQVLESLNLEGKSDYQKTKAIYNWICRNIRYDQNRDGTNLQRYTAAYAMINKSAVCEGYANLFYYLASEAGLENRIVVSSDHAWNIVKLGDRYYNLDTTWDAGRYDPDEGYANYSWRFFLKSDATFLDTSYYAYNTHHIRLSSDMVTDADFIAAHPVSATDYGTTENGITFTENNGTVTITGYTGEASELAVPAEIAGEPIGKIAAGALADEKLTSITFVSDAAEIEEGAFGSKVTLLLDPVCTNLIAYAKAHNISTGDVPAEQEENAWVQELTVEDIEKGGVVNPTASAKFGDVVFTYAASEDGEYTAEVPTEPGTYYVKASVAETETYTGLESAPVSFKITKAQNAWTKTLSMSDIYVGDAVSPSAEAKYGTVRYVYSIYSYYGSMDYTDTVPSAAGTYSVKAIVDETDEYTGLESGAVTFYIDKKTNRWVTELQIADITEGEALAPTAQAEHGTVVFTYASSSYGTFTEEAPTAAGTYYVKATVDADDQYNALTSSAVRFTIKAVEPEEDPAITELKEQLEAAKKAQQEAEAAKAEAETKLAEAEKNLAAMQEEKDAALADKTAAQAERDAAVASKEASDKELALANAQIEELNAELAKVKAELELANADESKAVELQNQLDAANEALEAAKAETEIAKNDAETARAAAETAQKAADEAKAEAEAAKKEAEEAKAEAEAAQKTIEEKNAEISVLNEKLTAAETAKTDADAAKTAAETAQKEAEEKLVQAQQNLAAAQEKLTEAETAKVKAEDELAKVTAEANASEEAKNQAVKEKEAAEAEAKAAKADQEAAEAAKEAAELAKAAAETEKAAAEKELVSANANIDQLKAELEQVNAELAKAKAALELVDADESKAVELQKQLDAANEALDAAKADAETAKAAAEKAKSEAEAAKSEAETAKTEAAAAQEALASAQKAAEEAKAEAEAAKKEAEEAKAAAAAKDEEIDSLKEQLENASDAQKAAETAQNEAETKLAEANKSLAEAQEKLTEAEAAKAAAQEELAKVTADAGASEEAKNQALKAKEEAEAAAKTAQAEKEAAELAKANAEKELANSQADIDALNEELAKVKAELEAAKKEAEELRKQAEENNKNKKPSVSYSTHVQNVGWQNAVTDGTMSGTSGQSLRLEGIMISINSEISGGIEYATHIQNIGWQSWKANGELSGTEGQALRLEAIKIRLTGELAEKYDVYYQVHAQNFGWLGWAKNGEAAGTEDYSYRLEGIRIMLVAKDDTDAVPSSNAKAFKIAQHVSYTTHVQNVGWQSEVKDGAMSGTSGKGLRLEGIKIRLSSQNYSGDIEYSTHVQNVGWQNYVKNGTMSGTSGQSLRLEGIKIRLTGEMAEHYDVVYRVHVQNIGWQSWKKNDEMAGTEGRGLRLEGIEIKLVEK